MQQPVRTKRMLAKRNFLGHQGEGFIRKGVMFDTEPAAAAAYETAGLAGPAPGRPSQADAQEAMAEDARQKSRHKSAKGESKEAPSKDASGLEPWPLENVSEETYVARYDGKDNSAEVTERLKLAKARIRAGVSAGAQS